ncbi:hypothetical protein [Psychromarinibacter sp. S121]|uniref:hypothetical protein n=1 Tax=Psychromarinibacter sp. S121 TaxID=3415127 RepID=UPI003C7D710F
MKLYAVILAFALAAPAAQACEPIYREGVDRFDGPNCGVTYFKDGISDEGISPADDLGGGFVRQTYFDGFACAATQSGVVIDCNAGQAVIYGPSALIEFAAEPGPENAQYAGTYAAVDAAAKAGTPLPLGEIKRRAAGMANAAIVPVVGKAIGISNTGAPSNRRYDLSCGCKVFYPGSAGAS